MRRAFQYLMSAFAIVLITSALLCSQASARQAGASSAAKARFREFLDRDWKYWMTEYPEFATIFGYPGQNRRWTDDSPAAIERRNRHLESSLKELHAIRRTDLPAEEQLNYDLYEDLYKTAIAGLRFHDDAFPLPEVTPVNLYMPVTQMDGVLTNLPQTIELMSAARASDYEDIIKRLESFPVVVDQAIALMNQGLAKGWAPPKITMRDVPKQAADQVVSDPLKSPLLSAFKNFPASISAQQQKDLTQRASAAYRNKVSPALAKLQNYLTNTYIPKCRVKNLRHGSSRRRRILRISCEVAHDNESHAFGDSPDRA